MPPTPTADTQPGPYSPTPAEQKAIELFRRCYTLAEPQHKKNVTYFRDRWADYLGDIDGLDKLPPWKSKLHPPYLLRAAETLYAQLAQLKPETAIEPMTPDDVEAAECMELVVQEQQNADNTTWKEQLLLKTGIILGIAGAKISWGVETITYDELTSQPMLDDQGQEILDPDTGQAMLEQVYKPCTRTVKNQPTLTVCDMHDLLYDPYARHPDEISFVAWRTWSTPAALKSRGEAKGPDGEPIYRNTEFLPDAATESAHTSQARDTENRQRDTKGRLPVWELHIKDSKGWRLVTLCGGGDGEGDFIVLRDVWNIHRHGQLPFVFFVTLPDLYGLRGISEVKAARDLQTQKWSQMNQRIDTGELVNTPVLLYDKGTMRKEEVAWFPGAMIGVQNAADVQLVSPKTNLIGPLEASERATLQEIDDLMGTGALMSGNDPTVDPRTAAEANGVRSAAQKRMAAKQNMYLDMRRRIGYIWVELNQQLMDEPLFVKTVGSGTNRWDFKQVLPSQVRDARLRFAIRSADEQLLDEERRTKAMQLFNTVIAAVPNLAQLATATGKMFLPNGEELMLELFRAFGVAEAKRLITQMFPPPPAPPVAGPSLAGGGLPASNGGPPASAAPPLPPNQLAA